MATIRDVARVAGVSIATVSRVFNGSPRVAEETNLRVRSAAGQLDYWPNETARSLITSRTNTLGVLLPDLYGDFFSEVIRGIDHAARAERLQVLISSSHADTAALVFMARSMRGRVDGLIMMVPDEGSAAGVQEVTRTFPSVLLNPRFEVEGCGAISIANFDGARSVVRHLLRLGHRTVAMIKGPVGNVDAEERLRGYHEALCEGGLEPNDALELTGDFTESAGYEQARELLLLAPGPTAVFAANDYMAIGLLSALREAGLRVPQDLAVVGFDDVALAQYMDPPLTTVRVDAYELGQRAVRQWLASARGTAGSAPREVLPTGLVVRQSCGAIGSRVVEARVRRRPETGEVRP